MKTLFFDEDLVAISYDGPSDSMIMEWKRFDSNLESLRTAHDHLFRFAKRMNIQKMLVDTSIANGQFQDDVLEYLKDAAYPTFWDIGIRQVAVVVPFQQSGLRSLHRLQRSVNIPFRARNFCLHSEAIDWLSQKTV